MDTVSFSFSFDHKTISFHPHMLSEPMNVRDLMDSRALGSNLFAREPEQLKRELRKMDTAREKEAEIIHVSGIQRWR